MQLTTTYPSPARLIVMVAIMAAILVAFLWVAISAGAFGLHGPAVHCTAAQESTRMICAR